MKIGKLFSVVGIFLLLGACSSNPKVEEESVTENKSDSGIVLAAAVVESSDIQFGKIEQKVLSHNISAQGEIHLLPQHSANVSVMIPGTILNILVDFGQHVNKGEVLATYTSHEFLEMQQLYLDTKANLEKVKSDYSRQKTLWETGVISEKEYQQSLLENNHATAGFNASEAEMILLHVDMEKLNRGEFSKAISIVSPIRGRVEEINVSLGKFINLGDPVLKVINRSEPMLRIKVFEKDIQFIQKDQRVTFTIPGKESDVYHAVVINVGSTVDQRARVVYVLARIISDFQDFIPGMFVSASIHTQEQTVDALPGTAVFTDSRDGRFGFYTLDGPGSQTYTFYPIGFVCGVEAGDFIEIQPAYPLPGHSRFVTTGTYYLKSEMLKNMEE